MGPRRLPSICRCLRMARSGRCPGSAPTAGAPCSPTPVRSTSRTPVRRSRSWSWDSDCAPRCSTPRSPCPDRSACSSRPMRPTCRRWSNGRAVPATRCCWPCRRASGLSRERSGPAHALGRQHPGGESRDASTGCCRARPVRRWPAAAAPFAASEHAAAALDVLARRGLALIELGASQLEHAAAAAARSTRIPRRWRSISRWPASRPRRWHRAARSGSRRTTWCRWSGCAGGRPPSRTRA